MVTDELRIWRIARRYHCVGQEWEGLLCHSENWVSEWRASMGYECMNYIN